MIREVVNGETHLILNNKTDSCPLCDTPLTEVCWGWNMFHGEATSSCCGIVCQLKSYHVDDSKPLEKEFAESLGKNGRIEFCLDEKYIEPLRRAFKETGVKDCFDKEVHTLVMSYLEEAKTN